MEPRTIVSHRIDSPLGCWTQTEWRPAHLAGIAEGLWHFDGWITYLRERVFPNGLLELIVHLDERYRLIEEKGAEVCPTVCVSGLYTTPFVVEAPPRPCRVLGVRLTPVGAYALLGCPLSEMNGLSLDLEDVVGRAGAELAERCHAAATAEECLRITAAWIAERVACAPRVDPAVAWIAAEIERSGGAVSIAALRERTGQTKTRLTTAFREQIGVPPKLYARIHRFRRVLALMDEAAGPLADIALAAGYYDQPHMNAEFRELSGFTPRDFLAATRYAGSTSIAETAEPS
jgi:methylphosphotriester-DNA--protein-cysteine methyltransferase